MTRRVGIGVIGMGWMGKLHSRSYRQMAERFDNSGLAGRLVICADDVEARAREAQQILGFEQCTVDWKQVIAHPQVEAVVVTAPNSAHLEIVQAAAAARKHIFCEKPVGRNPRETAAIERAAREAGVLTGVGYNYRWSPVVQYALELIREGKLGALTHYRGRFFAGYGSNPNSVLSWRFEREHAGFGTLGDLMSHVIDMAQMFAGPVQSVTANRCTFIRERPLAAPGVGTHFTVATEGPRGAVTNEDYVGALVRFTNGARGAFETCRVITGPKCQMAFEVHGTQGALSWDFERMNELNLFLPDGTGGHDGYTRICSGPEHPFHARFNPGPAVGLGYDDLKAIEAFQFSTWIAKGKQGEPGLREALSVARVQAAIERSWETGSWEEVERAG
ncbi:MAG: Gfo/Idh/MocA family oxidoreductase [Acidobacteria bacterium]|nr:Gfo/Idh/MocA family oxidoreductase [Acidobacteriota bacterium]